MAGRCWTGTGRASSRGPAPLMWEGSRRLLSAGEIDYEEFMDTGSAPPRRRSGTATPWAPPATMNALAEALGMMLPGAAAIPAPYRARSEMAYLTGRRAVEIAHEDLRPSADHDPRGVRERDPRQHLHRRQHQRADPHAGDLRAMPASRWTIREWQRLGYDLPLLVNMQPAGAYLGEGFEQRGRCARGDGRDAGRGHAGGHGAHHHRQDRGREPRRAPLGPRTRT